MSKTPLKLANNFSWEKSFNKKIDAIKDKIKSLPKK